MKLCPKCQKHFSDDANFCPVDAARLVPLEGQTAGGDSLSARFELGEVLGGGRTGRVYRAKDKQGGAAAAVKVIAPAVVALPGVAQRLERELKQLERVQSAGVAKVLGSGRRGEETWVALEVVEGAQTLAEAITARGPIALDQAAHLIEVIGEALIEAAQVGVVHRDLAPKNVLFAGADIKLINFSLPVPDKVPGVREFVAPEQADGKPVDQRSNLYSLGALYYYLLTGQTVQTDGGAVKTPSSLAPVPAGVEAVIMRALDRSPTKRFLTVRQFVDEVSRVARGEVDPKLTQAMGKAGRPKAELVQTLLGVKSGEKSAPVAVPKAPPDAPTMSPEQANAPTTLVGLGDTDVASTIPDGLPAMKSVAPPAEAMSPERSPWAPPATVPPVLLEKPVEPQAVKAVQAPAPVAPAPVVPAAAPMPTPAAPVLAAPVIAAPTAAQKATVPSGKAGGKKSKPPEEGSSKGKFRETMWFKKGELDVQAAEAAADERARTGKDSGKDKADSLPIDERYKDDGSISRTDKEKYSLRTGATQMMAKISEPNASGKLDRVSEDALIGEMKGSRNKIVIGGIVAVVAVAAIIIGFLATR